MSDRLIGGRYELESKVGSGGMGTVWKAKDLVLDRTVAVKLLHEGLVPDLSAAERFRREARAAARLSHPNIAAVHDTGEIPPDGEGGGVPFIVMEYVGGESLRDMLQRQGPLPVSDVTRIAHSLLAALDHAHERGLVHRDIKPANILFDAATGTAKVVDFGIAKAVDDATVTQTSSLIGTASYMSPEQLTGQNATPASDLYAVGCLLYCCLAGEPPFGGDTAVTIAMHHLNDPVPPLRSRRPDVPSGFETMVMRALEKDPAHRFATARDMSGALAAVEPDTEESTQLWTEHAEIQQPRAERIRVLLVDDHNLITQALAAMIDPEPDIEVVGRAGTIAEGIALALSLEPDVVLMDYELPDGDGVSAARHILADRPQTQIVMLTGDTSDHVLVAAIEAGCAGFVPKAQAVDEAVGAVRSAYAGEAPISPQLLARLLPKMRGGGRPVGFDLTPRETQILRMLAEGLPNQAIAERLGVALGTVRNHVQHVISKVGAHSKLEAVAIATREGLIDPKRRSPN